MVVFCCHLLLWETGLASLHCKIMWHIRIHPQPLLLPPLHVKISPWWEELDRLFSPIYLHIWCGPIFPINTAFLTCFLSHLCGTKVLRLVCHLPPAWFELFPVVILLQIGFPFPLGIILRGIIHSWHLCAQLLPDSLDCPPRKIMQCIILGSKTWKIKFLANLAGMLLWSGCQRHKRYL